MSGPVPWTTRAIIVNPTSYLSLGTSFREATVFGLAPVRAEPCFGRSSISFIGVD